MTETADKASRYDLDFCFAIIQVLWVVLLGYFGWTRLWTTSVLWKYCYGGPGSLVLGGVLIWAYLYAMVLGIYFGRRSAFLMAFLLGICGVGCRDEILGSRPPAEVVWTLNTEFAIAIAYSLARLTGTGPKPR